MASGSLKEVYDPNFQYTLRIPPEWYTEESFNISDRRCIIYTDRETTITVNSLSMETLDTSSKLDAMISEFVVFSDMVSKKKLKSLNGEIRNYRNENGNIFFNVAFIRNEGYILLFVESAIGRSDFYLPTLLKDATFPKSETNFTYKISVILLSAILFSGIFIFIIGLLRQRKISGKHK
jgi:hypothetical protein